MSDFYYSITFDFENMYKMFKSYPFLHVIQFCNKQEHVFLFFFLTKTLSSFPLAKDKERDVMLKRGPDTQECPRVQRIHRFRRKSYVKNGCSWLGVKGQSQ